jgi:hypothetical protein
MIRERERNKRVFCLLVLSIQNATLNKLYHFFLSKTTVLYIRQSSDVDCYLFNNTSFSVDLLSPIIYFTFLPIYLNTLEEKNMNIYYLKEL